MLRVALCDDEEEAREGYAALVASILDSRSIEYELSIFRNADELLFSLEGRKDPPDILLLDIMMPGMSGIEVGRKMRNHDFSGIIIFISRSADFTLPAFDVGAFNYVLKEDASGDNRLERILLSAVELEERKRRKYILLNGINEHRNVSIDSISYFEVRKHVVEIHYGAGETFSFVSTLGKLANTLAPFGFIQVHRSFVVNMDKVARYSSGTLLLDGGSEVPVGRKYAGALHATMAERASVSAGNSDVRAC